jgi:predicted permease
MSWLRIFRRKQSDAEVEAEIDLYLAEETAENMECGLSRDEARRQARIKLGNPQRVRESLRQQNTIMTFDNLWRDLRYATRTLRRTPGFAVIATLVMALGIGMNVALFTIVRSVLLKPLPFNEPSSLVMLYEHTDDGQNAYNDVAGGIYAEWKRENRTFSELALIGQADFNFSGANGQLPEKLQGTICTWNFLSTLGVRPFLGRDFTAADDQPSASGTALLSWGFWNRRFGKDPAILNQTIRLNSRLYTVIGVLPEWFAFPDTSTQLWTPVYHDMPAEVMTAMSAHQFQVIGRLKPGVTASQGVADLSVITRRMHDLHLDNPYVSRAAAIRPLLEDMVGEIKRPLYVLLAATFCVLLIACLNVANLLVARAAARRKELAIRSALGGGRMRLLREQLMESLLLSLAGGVAGLLLAFGGLQWLVSARTDMSRVESIHTDGAVAVFALGLIVLCSLFAGLTSSLRSKGDQTLVSLQDSVRGSSAGQGRARLRMALLTAEVGLTVVLLIGAGLLLKSYTRLRSSDLGCITKNVLTMRLDLIGNRYREPAQLVNFYTVLLTRVRALPGVDAAGFVQAVPGQGDWADDGFTIVEHPSLPSGQMQDTIFRWADPGYFAAMGVPIRRGHTFDENRRLEQANQTVISGSFAKQYFPGEDPLGKHLRFENRTYEIVGIASDTRSTLADSPKPMEYFPIFAGLSNNGELVIRSSQDVERLALPVQRAVQELDHDLPVSEVLTMDQLLEKSTLDKSFDATLLTGFAAFSLLLAAVGLFGVMSYIVAQRTIEIGIRIALGAQREQVLRLMLVEGLQPALFGLTAGLVTSAGTVRLIRSMLYDTQPLDPTVFALVSLALLLVAIVACLVPAWRASRLEPGQALRAE